MPVSAKEHTYDHCRPLHPRPAGRPHRLHRRADFSGPVATPAGPESRIVPTGTPEGCPVGTTGASGTLPGSGALYLICVPPGFDAATGSLVLYAPGSVPPQV